MAQGSERTAPVTVRPLGPVGEIRSAIERLVEGELGQIEISLARKFGPYAVANEGTEHATVTCKGTSLLFLADLPMHTCASVALELNLAYLGGLEARDLAERIQDGPETRLVPPETGEERAPQEDPPGRFVVLDLLENPYWQALRAAADRSAAVLHNGAYCAASRRAAADALLKAVGDIAAAFGPLDRTQLVLNEVCGERRRQDLKWGRQNHELPHWMLILSEEVGEVGKSILEREVLLRDGPATSDPTGELDSRTSDVRAELLQVAAVAVAMVECIDRAKTPREVKA